MLTIGTRGIRMITVFASDDAFHRFSTCEQCGERVTAFVGALYSTTARHHCRLCFRTVCSLCSLQNVKIMLRDDDAHNGDDDDDDDKDSTNRRSSYRCFDALCLACVKEQCRARTAPAGVVGFGFVYALTFYKTVYFLHDRLRRRVLIVTHEWIEAFVDVNASRSFAARLGDTAMAIALPFASSYAAQRRTLQYNSVGTQLACDDF